MRRVYRNVHIALISTMLLVAIAFEASAVQHAPEQVVVSGQPYSAVETR